MDFELTLLTKDQINIYGNNGLEVIEKEGPLAPITDFAILTGATHDFIKNMYNDVIITGDFILSTNSIVDARSVLPDALFKTRDLLTVYPEEFNLTIRPVLIPYNFDTFLKKLTLNKHGTYEMLYGKYPQFVDVTFSKEITYHFYHGKKGIQSTDKYFTINYPTYSNNKAFIPKCCPVYQYKKREFISVQANHSNYFTNGDHFEKDNYYWVEVTPITWLVDLKNKLLVSKYGLISGIRLKDNWNYDGNFNHTDIKRFLGFMKEEITPERKIGILENDQELQDMMLKRGKTKLLR